MTNLCFDPAQMFAAGRALRMPDGQPRPASMCNGYWHIAVKDRYGTVLRYIVRGPQTESEAIEGINHICFEQRRRALETGQDDPGLELVSVKLAGESDVEFGQFAPTGRVCVDLNRYAAY